MSFDKQGFKNALLSRGIQWDDKQIEDYIALKQSGQKLQQELSQPRDTSIMSQGINLIKINYMILQATFYGKL